MARVHLCLLLVTAQYLLLSGLAAARHLQDTGDVKSTTTLYVDINGGVAPLADRVEAAHKQNKKRIELVLAEAKCKSKGDTKCKEMAKIKKEIAKDEKEPKEKVEAPCYQNVFWSYFLGTVCDLPADSTKDGNDRPAPKKEDSSRRRNLLSWAY